MGYRNLPSYIKRIMTGVRAFTTKTVTEADLLNGKNFFCRAVWPLANEISAGSTVNLVITTGALPIRARNRIVGFIGEEVRFELFSDPTYTDGAVITPRNYNPSGPTSTVTFIKDPTIEVGDEGTPIDPNFDNNGTPENIEPEYYFGGSATGQRVGNSIPQGTERIIPPNTTFLIRITNTGSGNARFGYYLEWAEGILELPEVI